MEAANYIFVSKSNLDAIPIVNGQIIVISDSNLNELYIDINDVRHKYINDEYTFICNGEDDSTLLTELINTKLASSTPFNLKLKIVGNFKLIDLPEYNCEVNTNEYLMCYVPIVASNTDIVSNIELDFSNANIIEPVSSSLINNKNIIMFYLDANINLTISNLKFNKTNPLIGSLVYSKSIGTLNINDSIIHSNMLYDIPYSCITNKIENEKINTNLNNCEFYLNEFTNLINCESNCNINNCSIHIQKLHQYNDGNIKDCTLNQCNIFIELDNYISSTTGIIKFVELYDCNLKITGSVDTTNIDSLTIIQSEYVENTVIDLDINGESQNANVPLQLLNINDGTVINSHFNINQNNVIPYDVKFYGDVIYANSTNNVLDIVNNYIKSINGVIGIHITGNPPAVNIQGNKLLYQSYNNDAYNSTAIDINSIKYIFNNNIISKNFDVIINSDLIEELNYNNIRLDV